jgi:hypothetical protein
LISKSTASTQLASSTHFLATVQPTAGAKSFLAFGQTFRYTVHRFMMAGQQSTLSF